ncbi:MAG: hypothetical protein IJK52_09815, partial [Oscillospiraceae bacterium]|nr:hypothetical protein [Oscillospiraceae bacterium]
RVALRCETMRKCHHKTLANTRGLSNPFMMASNLNKQKPSKQTLAWLLCEYLLSTIDIIFG